jgi:hypothetical protein
MPVVQYSIYCYCITSIIFPYSFSFRTPDENDELRFHCKLNSSHII